MVYKRPRSERIMSPKKPEKTEIVKKSAPISKVAKTEDSNEEELQVLRTMVLKLNMELNKFQGKGDQELPNNCLDMKKLAPLVVAYEEEMKEKNQIILDYERQLQHLNTQ